MRLLSVCRLAGAALAVFVFAAVPALAAEHSLAWADAVDINVLNPLTPGSAANEYLNSLTMAFLTFSGNGPLEPDLAVNVPSRANGGISADGKTVTFTLRSNLKWSDGQPLTSADVAFSVALINDPKTKSADRTGYDLITSVDSTDPNRAVLHLSRSYGQFVNAVFSDDDLPILPKHVLEGHDVNTADYMQLPVGAGPFRYTKWIRGDRVELEANPYYHGTRPRLKRLIYRIIPNAQSTRVALRTGAIDFWPAAAKDDADSFADLHSVGAKVVYGARPAILMLNLASPSMSDPVVRRALRSGLNRASIIRHSYHGAGVLDDSVVAKGDPGYERIPFVAFNPKSAAAELDAAGWKTGAGGVRSKNGVRLHVTLAGVSGSATVDQIFELIRADWTALGVDVETRRFDAGIFFDDDVKTGILTGGKFDAAYFSYGAVRTNTLEAEFACKKFPPNGENYARACDATLDSLFRRYDATYDVKEQNAVSGAIQRRLNVILPFIVIAKRNEYFLTKDTVTGLRLPPFAPFGSMLGVDVAK